MRGNRTRASRVSLTPDSRGPVPFNRAIRTEDKPGRFIPAHPVSPLPVLRASLIPERPIRDNRTRGNPIRGNRDSLVQVSPIPVILIRDNPIPGGRVNRIPGLSAPIRGSPMRANPVNLVPVPFIRAIRTGDKPGRFIPAHPVSPLPVLRVSLIPGLSAPIRDILIRDNPVNRARSKDHRASPMWGNRDSPTPANRDSLIRDRRLPALPRSLSPARPGKWRPAGRIRPGLPPAGTRTLPAERKGTDPGPSNGRSFRPPFSGKTPEKPGKTDFFQGPKRFDKSCRNEYNRRKKKTIRRGLQRRSSPDPGAGRGGGEVPMRRCLIWQSR